MILPAALALKIPVLVKAPPVIILILPVCQLTVPEFVQLRVRLSVPPLLIVLVPVVVNKPAPPMPPADQLKAPFTVTLPAPVNVPPLISNCPLSVELPASVNVPLLSVNVPPASSVRLRASAAPVMSTLNAPI